MINDVSGQILILFGKTFTKLNELKGFFEEKGQPSSLKEGKDQAIQVNKSTISSLEYEKLKSPPPKIPTPIHLQKIKLHHSLLLASLGKIKLQLFQPLQRSLHLS